MPRHKKREPTAALREANLVPADDSPPVSPGSPPQIASPLTYHDTYCV